MSLNPRLQAVTDRIIERSRPTREAYLARVEAAICQGPARAHLSCSNAAHAYAAMDGDKPALTEERVPNLGIVTAYNDMLSAHQPFETYPTLIKEAARAAGATAQVAGGVPAMCDGVTQGRTGMELSLLSRDTIALAATVALSHDCFDAGIWLGMCDKIVPGLIIAAAAFGHVPAVFIPSGPMPSGLPNDEKARIRQDYAAGKITRKELMAAEMAAYHGPGICTFYGTANTNQMLMEIMGLMLPGAAFVPPGTELRSALSHAAVERSTQITHLGDEFIPAAQILNEKTFVNAVVGLMATGGSTNLILHLPAMARAAGIILTLEDFDEIAQIVPLITKIYPNGLADVNHFHAAGGMGWLVGELLNAGLLHADVQTIMGTGLERYAMEPAVTDAGLNWTPAPRISENNKILRPASDPFQPTGGLRRLSGKLGEGVIKISAVAPEHHIVEAPAHVFEDQHAVKAAFDAGELTGDAIIVVRFQGPRANGMPELHGLTPVLSILQGRGQKVALVTDGRMSGASGKVPAAIHVSPEAAAGGPLAKIRTGDIVRLDATTGVLDVLAEGFEARAAETRDLSPNDTGMGRELFARLRGGASDAAEGGSILY